MAVQYHSSAAPAIATSGNSSDDQLDAAPTRSASHHSATTPMKAGSTTTSRESHEVRHIIAARHARSGRPRWRNEAPRPTTSSTHRERAARSRGSAGAIATPASSATASATTRPCAAPATVVKTMTENAGFTCAALRPRACGHRDHARPSDARGRADRLGAAPWQVLVGRLGVPLRHQRVAAALADGDRDLRGRILHVAEQARTRWDRPSRRRAGDPPRAAPSS